MVRLLFDRRARLFCAGLWSVGWLAVTALLLLPLRGVPVPGGSDLIGHFLLFAAMAFAAVGFARSPAQLAWLAFVTVGLGAMLEFAQGVTPYRSSEFTDGVANSLGGLAGYAIALVVVYFVIRPAERKFGLATRGYGPNALATRDARPFRNGHRGTKLLC